MSRVNTPHMVVGTPSLESPTSLLLAAGSTGGTLRDFGGVSRQSLDTPTAARPPVPALGLPGHPGPAVPIAGSAVGTGHPRPHIQVPQQKQRSGSPGDPTAVVPSPSSYRSAFSHLTASPSPMPAPAVPPVPAVGAATRPSGAVGCPPSFHSPFEAAACVPSHTDSSASELRPTDTEGTVSSPQSSRALTSPSSTSAGPSPASLEPKQAERVAVPVGTGNGVLSSESPGVSHSYTLRRKPGPKSPFEAADLTPFPSQKLLLSGGPSPPRPEVPASRWGPLVLLSHGDLGTGQEADLARFGYGAGG